MSIVGSVRCEYETAAPTDYTYPRATQPPAALGNIRALLETLRRHSEGEIELAPPTFVTLSNLVQHASMDSLVETHRPIESERFVTKWITIEGGAVVMWADDAGYDAGNPDTAGPRHRVEMRLSGWTYLRSI